MRSAEGSEARCSHLAVYYHAPLGVDADGSTDLDPKIHRWLLSLLPHWKSITYFGPARGPVQDPATRVGNGGRLAFVGTEELGDRWSSRWQRLGSCRRAIGAAEADLLLVRVPTPRQVTVVDHARCPVVLYTVGFPPIRPLAEPSRLISSTGPIVLALTLIRRQQMKRLWKRLPVVTNSRLLVNYIQRYTRKVSHVPTASLWQHEQYAVSDRCQGSTTSLLFVGRVCRGKGLPSLLESVRLLEDSGKDVILHVAGRAGEGETLGAYKRQAEQLGVGGCVVWHGQVPMGEELWKLYRSADMLVLPSEHEGFPRVIWEALAHSVPVICTRVGGIALVLEDRRNARFLPDNSPRAITEAVLEVAADEDLRRTMIREGQLMAEENTLEKTAELLTARLEAFL